MRTSEKINKRLSFTLTDVKNDISISNNGLAQDDLDIVHEVEELEDLLDTARLQLEYLDEKFKKTGTTASVLSGINAMLNK